MPLTLKHPLKGEPVGSAVPSRRPTYPRDPVEQVLAEIWEALLRRAPIGIRDDFFAAGGSPQLAVTMMDRVEERCGARIPLSVFEREPTIEQLAWNLLESLREVLVKPWRILCGGIPELRPPRSRLLFLLHGDFNGGGVYTLELSRRLGREHPLCVLPAHGFGGTPLPESIEAMATTHLATIRSLQPRGPYWIAGYCANALVAFEIARRLEAEGETVENVFPIAPRPWSHRWLSRGSFAPFARAVGLDARQELETFGRLTAISDEWGDIVRSRLSRLRRRLPSILGGPRGGTGEVAAVHRTAPAWRVARDQRRYQLYWVYTVVNRGYVLRPYDGTVTLLVPENEELYRPGYPDRVWRKVVSSVDLQIIPGRHVSCVTRHLDVLADRLRARLR